MADYGGILAALISALKADTTLTDATSGLLAPFSRDGVEAPSRANSIFYIEPPTPTPPFPCITVWDIETGPAVPDQHDTPMAAVALQVQIDLWGRSPALRPIESEIDALLEPAVRDGAMDTADWAFVDIDTSGHWRSIRVPQEVIADSGIRIEQRSKTYRIEANAKTN